MATTGYTGTSNMRPSKMNVNPGCKSQDFWRNREAGWSPEIYARLTQEGCLTSKEATALWAALERGDFTQGQLLANSVPRGVDGQPLAGLRPTTNKNAVTSLIRKFGDGEGGQGLIRTVRRADHSRRISAIYEPTPALFSKFQIPIRGYKVMSTSTLNPANPKQYTQRPAPPEAPRKEGVLPPQSNYRFPGFPSRGGGKAQECST